MESPSDAQNCNMCWRPVSGTTCRTSCHHIYCEVAEQHERITNFAWLASLRLTKSLRYFVRNARTATSLRPASAQHGTTATPPFFSADMRNALNLCPSHSNECLDPNKDGTFQEVLVGLSTPMPLGDALYQAAYSNPGHGAVRLNRKN